MNKTCARCEKTVYPIEELKCLDKIWHKGCFKCQECGMTLNMKNYKGYGKLPYCEAHVPKVKATTMAVTPELTRIAENTKLQSNVKYHADFEKSKGKYTQVADDPETLRIKATTKIISNVAYHGELEKKAAMEKQRTLNENGEVIESQPSDNYQLQLESYASEMLPPTKIHQQASDSNRNNQEYYKSYPNQPNVQLAAYPTSQKSIYDDYPDQTRTNEPQRYEQRYPEQNKPFVGTYQDQSRSLGYSEQRQAYSVEQRSYPDQRSYSGHQQQQQQAASYTNQKIGRIADYDPISDGPRAQPFTGRQSVTLIYSSDQNRGGHPQQQQQTQQQGRRIGNVADLDPVNNVYGSVQVPPQQQQQRSKNSLSGQMYVAMYDYEAVDNDEVSFREGDIISNVTSIDEGWMTGQVMRTGHTGMLPANYVEPCDTSRYH